MLEESLSILASMNSWLTPYVFFVLLNLMIGTIFVTSRPATYKPSDQHQEQGKHIQAQLDMATSFSLLLYCKNTNL